MLSIYRLGRELPLREGNDLPMIVPNIQYSAERKDVELELSSVAILSIFARICLLYKITRFFTFGHWFRLNLKTIKLVQAVPSYPSYV